MAAPAVTATQGIVALVTACVYAYVARLILSRHPSPDARLANHAFAVWWVAFGLLEAGVGVYQVATSAGYQDLAMVITLLNVMFLLIVVALWGLVYYLVYLYTGSARAFWPITVAYGILAVALLYLIAWLQPDGFKPDGTLSTARQLSTAPAIVLGLSLSLPVVLAALGYGSLYFQAEERTQKFRIAMVAGSFVLWFGWSSVSSVLQLSQRYHSPVWLTAINSAISLVVPLLVVAAYKPPRWLRERLHVGSVQGPA